LCAYGEEREGGSERDRSGRTGRGRWTEKTPRRDREHDGVGEGGERKMERGLEGSREEEGGEES
jgi:hypothetical protein